MPFESTMSRPSLVLAVIAMGLPDWPAADGAVVEAAGGEVGDDDETLPPDDPHAASNSAAEAASARTPYRVPRFARVERVPRVPGCFVDILVLIVSSNTS